MKKTSKLTRVLAGFAALLMCGAAMTGCSKEEIDEINTNGAMYTCDEYPNAYIRLDEMDFSATSGEAWVQNVPFLSQDPLGPGEGKLFDWEKRSNGQVVFTPDNDNDWKGPHPGDGFYIELIDNDTFQIMPDAANPYDVLIFERVKTKTK